VKPASIVRRGASNNTGSIATNFSAEATLWMTYKQMKFNE